MAGPELIYDNIDVAAEIEAVTLRPYGQRILVVELEAVQAGNLYVPDSAKTGEMQSNHGFVVAVGDDVDYCCPGDHVFYGRYSGAWINWKNRKYRIMNEDDLLGKVEE